MFALGILCLSPDLLAQSPRDSKDALRSCIDRVVARSTDSATADSESVLADCSTEYDAFLALLDDRRQVAYQALIRDYIAYQLGRPDS